MADEVILVPLDGSELSERALPYVAQLARKAGARLHLLSVFEGIDFELRALQSEERLAQIRAEVLAFYQSYLDGARTKVQELAVETEVGEGQPADVILAAAARLRPLMIALSTHGRSGITRAIMGSVADRIVRANRFPTLLVRPHEEGRTPKYEVDHVLVPVDGSRRSEAPLPLAARLAAQHGAIVTLLRVVPYAAATIYAPGYAGPAFVAGLEEVDRQMEADAERYLARLAGRLRGVRTQARVVRGSPFAGITSFARANGVDLIVMNTHGRSGLRRFALGSVTDRVVHDAGVPVLVVPGLRHD